MNSIRVLVLFAALFAAAVAQSGIGGSLPELTPEFCASIEDSLLFPYRCVDSAKPLGEAGRTFMAKAAPNLVLDPVVILPGLGGSGLEAKLNKPNVPHWYCTKEIDWFRIWLHLEELAVQDCWLSNMDLEYDMNSGLWSEPAGVQMRPIDYGGVKGIDYLDYQFGSPVTLATYYGEMIKSMQEVGYVPGVNLRGVPYDWRYTPVELQKQGMFAQLQTLIEDTRAKNNNRTVHIIGHSQGCLTALAFLQAMDPAWVDDNIATYIPIAGPFGGASKALRAAVSGDDFGLHIGTLSFINRLKLRDMVSDFGGVLFLAPNEDVWGDTIIVNTTARPYRARDMAQLFTDMKNDRSVAVYERVKSELVNLGPPRVTTHCLYGTGVATEVTYNFPGTDFNAMPEVVKSSYGDGTVPLESLRECIKWSSEQEEPVYVNEFNLKNHIQILRDEGLIHYVLDKVTHSS